METTEEQAKVLEVKRQKSFWFADWSFPLIVGIMSAAVFAGTHMYVMYGVGAFNEVSIVAMLKAGLDGGSYGAAAAFGASFLFARILEGSLVGILDLGGSILTGIGIGVPAILLSMKIAAPIDNFALSLLTGLVLGLIVGGIIVLIRKFTIDQSNSTFDADVMMGAGNSSGRFFGSINYIKRVCSIYSNRHWRYIRSTRILCLEKTNCWRCYFRSNDFRSNLPGSKLIERGSLNV